MSTIAEEMAAANAIFNKTNKQTTITETVKPDADVKLDSDVNIAEARTAGNQGEAIYKEITASGVYWPSALKESLKRLESNLVEYATEYPDEDDTEITISNAKVIEKMVKLTGSLKEQ